MKNQFSTLIYLCILLLFSTCSPVKEIPEGEKVNHIRYGKVKTDGGKTLSVPGSTKAGTTVIYLVRHAEKELKKDDPKLTPQGEDRAEKLAQIFSEEKIDMIYSSDYRRTKDTAQPIANLKKLEIQMYNPRKLEDFGDQLLKENAGKHILIVGHSNTTPNLLNHFMGEKVVEQIQEIDYENLYAVSISKKGEIRAVLLKF